MMSRIGKIPVGIPEKVKVEISGSTVVVDGPRGSLKKTFGDGVDISELDGNIIVKPSNNSVFSRSMWGTSRSIINSMTIGVTTGFKQELEVNGVGYRVSLKGKFLNLILGKSHATKIEIPDYINISVSKQNLIILESIDKEKLGHYVAIIRNQRPPEPYKGKGIKRKGEYIQRKEGKKG